MTANERVARHYERKAALSANIGRGAEAWFFGQWAGKARGGKQNPLTRRLSRMMEARNV